MDSKMTDRMWHILAVVVIVAAALWLGAPALPAAAQGGEQGGYYAHTGSASVGWRAQYFGNRKLGGSPVLERRDPAPSAQPAACPGGPLRLDAWPVGRTCAGGGWTAKVFVEGHGGDCRYTYSWESQVQGGPVAGPMTFELRSASRGIAIVGQAAVTSAGQTAVVGLRIRPPEDCR